MYQLIRKAFITTALLVASITTTTGAVSKELRVQEETPALLSAGVLRIESERSYKLGLQVALRILDGYSQPDRDRSLVSINRSRLDLASRKGKTDRINRALDRATLALNDQLSRIHTVSASTAGTMYDINEDVLNKLNALSFAFEAETDDTDSRIVGLALRQASLAQRMAKITLLRSLDAKLATKQGLEVDMTQSRIEFVNGLELLNDEANTNRMLADRINLAKQQWLFYDAALMSAGTNRVAIADISTTSDRIAELMIEIVHLAYGLPPPKTQPARIGVKIYKAAQQ